jgi:2-polyprenyl-3-methyl-5-hydroxy-6-metoxy-1,4-benzoquinol methylase
MSHDCCPSGSYFHIVRKEIRPLLPANSKRALEVGAASGRTLKWLKSLFPNMETTGVELNDALLPDLRRNADRPLSGPIEEVIRQLKEYDLILLLDVLEHLTDSLGTLKRLVSLLNPNGTMIVSLPNVSHLSVSIPLLLKRRFEYQDAGILDRTHLRFFTESSAVGLLNDAGLTVSEGLVTGLQGSKSRLLDVATFGALRHYLTKQYIMSGRRSEQKQGRVCWKRADPMD